MNSYDVIIIGGGAAGFFTAVNAAEKFPDLKIVILERGKEVLNKVKISGGGRCNVTHAEFIPKELTRNYPRGEKELLGPFHTFMTGDTMEWFENRGVELKIEEDGRIFPVSDDSQTIIDCFLKETERLGIEVLLKQSVKSIQKRDNEFIVETATDEFIAEKIVVATGNNPKVWKLLESLGHKIISPVPSLFTFNIKDSRIADLAGISTQAIVKMVHPDTHKVLLEDSGPLLITHWGMSGPAILKLSAWGARILEPLNYQFKIEVNWLGSETEEAILNHLKNIKHLHGKQTLHKYAQFELPKRLWQNLLTASGISDKLTWAEITKNHLQNIFSQLSKSVFEVSGKSTFKEEFVTAGGVDLKEIDFKTFQSKLIKDLYLVGEVLNVDAITGGFNFQNAWTGGFIAAGSMSM